ncbi:MAG: protein kinase, partial [Cyanobacteriota bacterium]
MEKEDQKILLGKYQLIKEIGRGGMGVIYLAQDPTLNRPVAVKELIVSNLIDKEERDDLIERFRREALSAASLNHQNIVTIFEVGKDEDIHFIAMEYLEGITLKDYIDQNLSYSFSDIIDIMIQIVNGLAHAHSRGIIHRDIKPENIRIINENTVKIMDFGIAGNKKNDPTKKRLTQNGTILGTIGYMSPEQLYDLKLVDNRSDIFSYGVMFYEFFTGKLPFESDSIGQSIMNIMQIDPIKPSEINSSLPIEICNMIMKCLEKNPEKRYQNFSEISQDLNLQKFLIMNSAILNDLSLENITKPKETFKFSQKGTHENVNSNTLVEKSKKLMNSILKSSNRVSEIADFYDSKLNIKHLRTFNDLDTKFSSPRNIFLSKKGFLFVADTKNKMVQILDKIGNLNFILCHENMNSPCAISQDNNENIYILDSDDCKVRVFDKNYKHLFEFAGQGNSSNNLKSASSIVVSSDNKVYISDH